MTAKKAADPSVSVRVEADGAVTVGVTVDGAFVPVAGATVARVEQAKAAAAAAAASDDDTGKEG